MTRPPPKLEWRGVSKRFGAEPVLNRLNLTVPAGCSLVIIGGSGQGKSVMIKLALGLIRPDAGKLLLDGKALPGLGGRLQRRLYGKAGVLFQGAALFDSLSVWENVAFRLINADGVPRKTARRRALAALERVKLDPDIAERFPSELSGGMQKRVGLARAIAADPEILFFDEPTTGLDPITAAVINDLIVDQVKRLGCTTLSITHDLASARRIGDEIAMLHEGQIVWRGPAADLDRTDHPQVRAFVDMQSA
ncbi:MAG: ATP-binding cassette domain-containing protein [Phenylobacterium sp.]|uniref:ABC transporter ATP-binding protein n=1 Tax=Phenylobacterium sp. TaxID=1871053 RepID=UPI001B7432C2|nr:ATP-binding cassette domain-containing protein [Phenylobacterium sp.]MBP7650460.1 ATP-binding cassette domain-containing protein [Phenylobacterium sp.]MBP7814773.1 ATP-binding cassette domain-containing protein [Phenylobacterium sp.]MBP9754797.1 ATP-binding cassette domain-containing protein [Phenylobacterium sp.]